MKIVVINGTGIKGCTHAIKEAFLMPLREGNEILEFFPEDMPGFCLGCKTCFFESADGCPHAERVKPVWNAVQEAGLIVVTAPVYGLGIPASVKSLLDHICVRWMVHRPEPSMFTKRAAILTNAIGPGFIAYGAQRDIRNALSWMGISNICRYGAGLLEGVVWQELSLKRRGRIERKARLLGEACKTAGGARKSVAVCVKFMMCKVMHQLVARKETSLSADNRYWLERGWIKVK